MLESADVGAKPSAIIAKFATSAAELMVSDSVRAPDFYPAVENG
jgi:hypothetical protein